MLTPRASELLFWTIHSGPMKFVEGHQGYYWLVLIIWLYSSLHNKLEKYVSNIVGENKQLYLIKTTLFPIYLCAILFFQLWFPSWESQLKKTRTEIFESKNWLKCRLYNIKVLKIRGKAEDAYPLILVFRTLNQSPSKDQS